ncbi:MAG: h domain protein [Rhodococcus sp. (in: high G+C Gram-positive bacteria)]
MTRRRTLVTMIAAVVVMLVAIGSVGALVVRHQRLDAQESARADVVRVASDQAVAMLSYRHETVDEQLAAAAGGLTGDFRDQYQKLVAEAVAPSAKEKSIDTAVTVVGASVESLDGRDATVLLFLNQVTTSAETPDPTTTGSRVTVGLTDVDGNWAVSGLAPV